MMLFAFLLSVSVTLFLMLDGQKLGQHRRSKRLLGKQTRIQVMGAADFEEDIFDDSRSSSEDGKAG